MSSPAKRDPSQRRRGAITASVLILLTVSAGAIEALSTRDTALRSVDIVRISAVLFLALLLTLRATTNFSFVRRDPALDDELTRANRASAGTWGLWALMLATLGAFLLNMRWPMSVAETLPVLIILGAAVSGIRFVFLERRGE